MAKQQPKNPNRELAARKAQVKLLDGKQSLTAQEKADVAWIERSDSAFYVDLFLKNCPKGIYCELAGRQQKVIDSTAKTYGFPVDGPTVNLHEAVKALHDFVAKHGSKVRSRVENEDDREELEKEKLRCQIEGINLDNEHKEIDLQEARGDAIPKDTLRIALSALQAHLRSFGQQLRRDGAAETVEAWNTFLDGLAAEVASGKLRFE